MDAPNPELVHQSRVGGEDFLSFTMGRKSVVTAVSPSFYRNTFTEIGSTLRPKTFISATPPTGTNIDLQVYCTNTANNVFHAFMGQCRLNTLVPNAPGSCDIAMNASVKNSCFNNGAFAFEFDVQAPTTYKAFVGVGQLAFAGTLERTAAAALKPICPRPSPYDFSLVPRPLWKDLGGTPTTPTVNIDLGSGGNTLVIPNIYLPFVLGD